MKLCKDCKHYCEGEEFKSSSRGATSIRVVAFCENPECAEPIYGHPVACETARLARCGPDGWRWEAK